MKIIQGAQQQQTYGNMQSILGNQNFENIRILKRNLIYLQGLPKQIASAEILKSSQFLGQYGCVIEACIKKDTRIKKKNNFYNAHINFKTDVQAAIAIICLNGFKINGNQIKASFGMTKFCQYFLQDEDCPKKNLSIKDLTSTKNKHINNNIRQISEIDTINFILKEGIKDKIQFVKYPIFPCVNMGVQKINNFKLKTLNGFSLNTNQQILQQNNLNSRFHFNYNKCFDNQLINNNNGFNRYNDNSFQQQQFQNNTLNLNKQDCYIRKQFRQYNKNFQTFQINNKVTKHTFQKKKRSKRTGKNMSSTDDESQANQDFNNQNKQRSIKKSIKQLQKKDAQNNFDCYLRTPTIQFYK